ncbi:hypothetical protein QEN19_002716 [Hanseniaspora menglaensis]
MAPKKKTRGRPRKNPIVEKNEDLEIEDQLDFHNIYERKNKSDDEFEIDDDDYEQDYKVLKSRKVSNTRKKRATKKEQSLKLKKKSQPEEVAGFADEDSDSNAKYKPGKFPAKFLDEKEPLDKTNPLDEDSELWRDRNDGTWDIPDFASQLYDTIEKFVWKRGPKDDLIFFKDFIRWPSRKFYPEYYHRIPTEECVSLKDLQKRSYAIEEDDSDVQENNGISADIYNYEKLILDIDKLYKNCSYYNEKDTQIVKAAYQLANLIKLELLKLKNEYRNYEITQELKKTLETKVLKKLEKVTEKAMFETLKSHGRPFPSPDRALDTSLKLIDPFLELVPKEEFPDYYQVIYKPISAGLISANLKSDFYKTVYDFYVDLELLFLNAKTYNDQDSFLHIDATHLLSYSRVLWEDVIKDLTEYNKKTPLSLYKPYEDRYMKYKKNYSSGQFQKTENYINSSVNGDSNEYSNWEAQQQRNVSVLNEDEIILLQNGGKLNQYSDYIGNTKFKEPSNIIVTKKPTTNDESLVYDKNKDLLSNLFDSKVETENIGETSFTNLKLTFFQDYRFSDKNVTNVNLGDFETLYSTSSKIKETSQKDSKKVELYQYNLKNTKPSKSYTYSIKNPLSGSKNLYTHLELNLMELGLPYEANEPNAPYKYTCQVYFNNLVGGAPVIVRPKQKSDNENEIETSQAPLICLYNIKLSQKRSFVSIVITREKYEEIDLKETINLWFNV